jgi:hypothetical protein
MWKESVDMLARVEAWCNKKVQKEAFLLFVAEIYVEVTSIL